MDTLTDWAAFLKKIAPPLFVIGLFFFIGNTAHGASNSIYLAQSAQGNANGSSCSNTYAISFFNNPSNWGTALVQIGPGTTVYLCGTITTNLSFQGNGANGSPIVLDGTNASMQALVSISTQYWTVQNLTYPTGWNANGNIPVGTVHGAAAAYGTIQNNHIDVEDAGQFIFLGLGAHDITIQNNYLKNSTPAAGDGFQSDGLDSEGAYNVLVQGNYLAMDIGAGDQNCSGCHDDIAQVWAASGAQTNAPYNWTFRYNNFVQESSPQKINNLSLMIMENIGTGYWDVYSNVYQCVSGGNSGNGIAFDSNYSGATIHIYNNTVVENSGGCNNLFNISGSGSFYLENNLVYSTDAGNALTGGEIFSVRSNNLWYGSDIPSCLSTEICGKNPLFTNYNGNDFTLQSGSPAVGAGINIGSNYSAYPLAETTWPNPAISTRPASAAWDIGAYQFMSGGGSGPDTTPPSVSITAPTSGSTLTGTVMLSANASDNVGVTSVQFKVDGTLVGTDVTSPFILSWNSATVANGTHTITATASDAAGNQTTSSGVAVTVSNTVASSSSSSVAFVQKASAASAGATSLSVSFPSNVTTGNLLLVGITGWPLPTTLTATDSRGNTYSAAGIMKENDSTWSAIYYAANVTGGVDTVTVSNTTSNEQFSVVASEFSGIATASPLDASAGATGSSAAPSSGNMTPSTSGDLVIGAGTHDLTTVTSPGTGFAMAAIATEDSSAHQPGALEYQVANSTNAVTATFSLAGSGPWVQSGALFKAASGGSAVAPDTISPTTAITSPAPGANVSSTVNIIATASDNVGVAKVEFYLDNALQFTDTTAPYLWSWNTTSTSNGSHTIEAKAYDAAGNVGTSIAITVTVSNTLATSTPTSTPDIVPPSVPAALNASVISSSEIMLSWNTSTDNVGVMGYQVFQNGIQIATTTTPSYEDTSLAANTVYTYAVSAFDAAGNHSAVSASVNATTQTAQSSSGGSGSSGGGGSSSGSGGGSTSGSGSSGGGGGGSSFGSGTNGSGSASSDTSSSTVSSNQVLLVTLLAELQSLIKQLDHQLVMSFTRSLTIGSSGQDVENLQIFLNDNGYTVAASGAGSPGNEVVWFGNKTAQALAEWQKANGLPSTGYFGALTRAAMDNQYVVNE